MAGNNNDSELLSLLSINLKSCKNKADLLNKAVKLQSVLKASANKPIDIESSNQSTSLDSNTLDNILSRLELLENDNKKLKRKVHELNKYADECDEKIYSLENHLNQVDQYIRRENITLSGLPENTEDLEEKVIDILGSIDVHVQSNDIVACHRLTKTMKEKKNKEPSKVIVRFKNRKHAISSHINKKKLREKNLSPIYINEQLCPAYQKILEECLTYKYEKKISSCWSFNGTINIKFSTDRTEKPIRILCLDDLRDIVEDSITSN